MRFLTSPPPVARVLAGLGLLLLIALAAPQVTEPHRDLRDFGTFVQAGEAYDQGLNPYVLYETPDPAAGIAPGTPKETGSPNLNPPISIYPFSLIPEAGPFAVRDALSAVSAVVYAGVCLLLLRAYARQPRPLLVLWLAAVSAFWYTLLLGQIYMALFALGSGALLLSERGRNAAWTGLLIGLLVAIKPNFGIWPLFLLLAGHRRTALTAFAAAAAVSAVPLVLEGPSIYSQWLDAARAYPRAALSINASIFGVTARLGVAEAGYVVAAAAIAAGGFYAWRWRLTSGEAGAWGVMLTLFVGPLTWVGYTLLMLPLLLSRRWAAWEIVVAATMLLPPGLGWPAGEIRLAGIVMLSGLVLNDALRARQAGAKAPRKLAALSPASEAA